MLVSNVLTNPVNLKTLKSKFYREFSNFTLVLKDDIWKRGILILRGGKYLTEDMIDRLLNFGINEVNIHLDEDDCEEEHKAVEELKRNFIKTQNILLIDKDFDDMGYIVKNLVNIGFNKKNIYVSTDIKVINKYLQDRIPDYLFVSYKPGIEAYIKAIREVEVLKDIHIFLTASIDESELGIRELENKADSLSTKFILKPVIAGYLKKLVSQTIDQDFCKLLKNEDNTNSYKYSVRI
ncbi:MAG: hypothetical protein A2287_03975 [Candidatus Melainabacteria bacterium RIFOXYA12_FULL_32_12]|nr:MAG: hypothetical protein A2255_07865 [Candidatus Melainabacteria bacterium RIFOXYA2_FULL_32_9]OGI31635.1 MAG: hypothetical protein A2287_03975 [Candidatus Melainabacteria bacterium RIFOXYA12_FULL_32_12]